jgi:signal transduction histidine kinase
MTGDGEKDASLSSGRPFSRLSFHWQIILLGTLVVVLSVAVLFAIVATLHYTKSAVLKDEKDRLVQTARNLAQEYEDRADIARQNHQPPLLGDSNSSSSQDVLTLLSRVVLQNVEGAGGGFYSSSGDSLIGYFYPDGGRVLESTGTERGNETMRDSILAVARRAASSHETTENATLNAPGIILIEAVPLRDGYSVVGSAWSVKRLPDLPGVNRFRAYLITTGLGATALASVLLTLFVIRNLQSGVRRIEGSLRSLEGNLTSAVETVDEPKEIQHIVQAINRLGATLQENIEHEKLTESRLRHSERLASLGRLVAGVAHEVRNPLATIRLRVQMSLRESDNAHVRESCTVALLEIERLNGMVNHLLSFARPVQLQIEPVDVGKLVEERIESFRDLASRRRVGMIVEFQQRPSTLPVDKGRMAQVFDNIIQNAIESMSDRGGTLTVTDLSDNKLAANGREVCMEFRDTGKGMSTSIVGHAFDPFFTTKVSGIGLGLSICHELIHAHGGDIRIESAEGRGTSVRITLPANLKRPIEGQHSDRLNEH